MQPLIPAHGAHVWIRRRLWRVERVRRSRNVVRLDVRDRHGRLTFFAPFDRPAPAGAARRPKTITPRSAAARLAHLLAHLPRHTSLNAAIGASVDILPYQLEPTLALLAGTRRILIADVVGLGKTMEAGIALAELEKRNGTLRALVLCPATLREQWACELSSRLSLTARIVDRDALIAASRDRAAGDTLWTRAGVWIGSFDYLKQPQVLDGIPPGPWDVVVIDEAHEVSGDTERHDACQEIARRARHVLLLTATPHSGDEQRFTRLRSLGVVGSGRDGEDLVVFRRTRQELGPRNARRVRWHTIDPSPQESKLLDALLGYERTVLRAASGAHETRALLLLAVFRKRALSTAAALLASLTRRLAWLSAADHRYALDWIQPPLGFEEVPDGLSEDERTALMGDVGLRESDERTWLRRLLRLAEVAAAADSKVQRLEGLVHRAREPVVIFTEFRDSLALLQRRLGGGGDLAVLHGGQSPGERRDQLRRFLDGHCRALITTDVGGQGLNLQSTARWVVNLELPWNPARLEQRIGRVDRIGQTRSVHATLLVARHPAEQRVLSSLARRTLAAQYAFGVSLLTSVAPPTELAVARSVLTGQPPPVTSPDTHPHPELCTRWRRPAAALARQLGLRRVLAARWRHEPLGSRAMRCFLRRQGRAPNCPSGTSAAVYAVPLTDGSGTVVEQHLLILTVDPGIDPAATAVRRAARSIAVRRLAARHRRVTRLVTAAARCRTRTEEEIGHHLYAISYPEQTQTELFTRRTTRAFDEGRRNARGIEEAFRSTVVDLERSTQIEIGEPVLELFFIAR